MEDGGFQRLIAIGMMVVGLLAVAGIISSAVFETRFKRQGLSKPQEEQIRKIVHEMIKAEAGKTREASVYMQSVPGLYYKVGLMAGPILERENEGGIATEVKEAEKK